MFHFYSSLDRLQARPWSGWSDPFDLIEQLMEASTGRKMQVKQGALVTSTTKIVPVEQLIRQVIGHENDLQCVKVKFDTKELDCYPWHIKNKYYESDVHLIHLAERDLVSASFAEVIQAVVLVFSAQEESTFQEAKMWLPFIEEFDPQVRILVCERASEETPVKRADIHEWCIKNAFELVELDPVIESDDEVEDDFTESNSYIRIRQALHAHTWPFMEMSDPPEYTPSDKFSSLRDIQLPDPNTNSASRVDELLEETSHILEEIEGGDSAFENLFEKFRDMKEKASQLEGEDRRVFAEKTTIAFWKAIGGNPSEIQDLDSD